MARALVALAAFVFLPLVCLAEDQPEVTLEEAIKLALARHPEVDKARATSDILKGKIREVRSQALPEITLNANALRWRDPSFLNASGFDNFPPELLDALVPVGVNIFDYNVSVKQLLYSAGRVGTALRLASVEQEASLVEIDRAQQEIALGVTRAYYGLLWAMKYRDLVLETQRQRQAHADMARRRFENGVATEVDVLRSEVNVANGAPDLVRAENAIRQTRALLNYYLVRPIDFGTTVSSNLEQKLWEEWDLESLMMDAARRRPELVRLRHAERSAQIQIDLAKSENRTRVDFNTAYGVSARLPENLANKKFTRWSVGVGFSLPLFDGFKRSGLVYQATANERAARLGREQMEQQVRLAIQRGLDELTAAAEMVAAARANIHQAERVLTMMQNNYKWGAATTLDMVDAQTSLLTARTNLLKGLHDYAVSRAELRWTIGRTPWE
jgi:outer membrane protein TolC